MWLIYLFRPHIGMDTRLITRVFSKKAASRGQQGIVKDARLTRVKRNAPGACAAALGLVDLAWCTAGGTTRWGRAEAVAGLGPQMMEDLEQLKVLENGYKIKAIVVQHKAHGVDEPEDVAVIEGKMRALGLT